MLWFYSYTKPIYVQNAVCYYVIMFCGMSLIINMLDNIITLQHGENKQRQKQRIMFIKIGRYIYKSTYIYIVT